MKRFFHALTAVLLMPIGAVAAEPSDPRRHFIDLVKPLLDGRCISCHGPDKVKGGLRLDSRAAILKGGDTGPSAVLGKPAESLLVAAVMHSNKDLTMPPKEKLTPKDIAVLERWIRDGLPWPDNSPTTTAFAAPANGPRIGDAWTDARNPIVKIFGGQRLDLWSFKPVTNPPLPKVKKTSLVRSDLDRFTLARLESAKAKPVPEADRRTLMRRLSFDLAGLPPTPEQVAEFERDRSGASVDRLVERLLATPRFGEHWARLWLDTVRYSDSNGFDWDEFRPQAWRYRDYVIRSLNADKPFDEFIREQLAGDELLSGAPATAADRDRLIATGFLRLGPHDNSAPTFNEQDRSRAELMADLVETTGGALLGLTMSCCRCHDHKYDPLSQADHFRLRAFFEPVKFADDLPLNLGPDQQSIRSFNTGLDGELKPVRKDRDDLVVSIRQRLRAAKVSALSSNEQLLVSLPKDPVTEAEKSNRALLEKKVEVSDKEIDAGQTKDEKARREELSKQIAAIDKRRRSFETGLLMTDGTNSPPPTRILFQGDHKSPRDPVLAGFPSILDPNPAAFAKPANPSTSGRRLALAEWIVSGRNPLTARVFVNRVWSALMGRPLVDTPNDFGFAGAKPTDAALLDHLASEFVRDGWRVKRLVQRIVSSSTYRQAATPHVEREELSSALRQPRRLTAEQLRDSILQVSGLLTARSEGPPVWPDIPQEVLEANPAILDDNKEKTKGWYPSAKEEQFARSIFLVQKRNTRVPLLEAFDQPDNAVPCAKRAVSTVAPQALTLLNGSLAIAAANALAARVERESGSDRRKQVQSAFALAYQRRPDRAEAAACLGLLNSRGLPDLCRALLNANEFVYLD